MMKRWVFLLILCLIVAAPGYGQIGGRAGAYSRLGFGARGMGMGNALAAVTSGDLAAYYNPASIAQGESRTISASFGILSLDRKLNFLSYGQPVKPNAGIFLGILNSGVSDIDGRDSDGEPTGPLRTSENQALLGFSIKFRPGFSLGINFKYLYHHLYTEVNSGTFGIDLGALVPIGDVFTVALTVRDINSRYKWDTSKLYGDQSGRTTEDKFPQLYTFAGAYIMPDSLGLISAEIEASNQQTLVARFGVEVPLIPELTLRAGMDRIDLKEKGNGVKPTFGFTARRSIDSWTPAVNYAFVIEPFAASPMHIVSLSVVF
jgi:hypothetical protein